MIRIREALLDDMNGISRLYFQLSRFGNGLSPDYKSIFSKMQENDAYYLMVAVDDDDQVVGSTLGIICQSLAESFERFLVIEDVIVDENCRRAGIGRALFSDMERIAQENKCAYAILVSSGYRKEAHHFYRSVGFTEDVVGFRKQFGEDSSAE